MIDEADDTTIGSVVPFLARLLQEFDLDLHPVIKPGTAFAAAIDARTMYVLFKGIQRADSKERRRLRGIFAKDMMPGQYAAIEEAATLVKKGRSSEIRPCAVWPLFRSQPRYQNEQNVKKGMAEHLKESR
jgi:hypothetical protein